MALNLFTKPTQPAPEPPASPQPEPPVQTVETTASNPSNPQTSQTPQPPQTPKQPDEDGFERAIRTYLEEFGRKQPAFAAKYRSSAKTIRQCCDYLIDTARKKFMLRSGKCAAMSDEDTYGLAVHFFEEDSIKPVTSPPRSAKVVHSEDLGTHKTTPSTPSVPSVAMPSQPSPSPKSKSKPKSAPKPKTQPQPEEEKEIDLFDLAAENGFNF